MNPADVLEKVEGLLRSSGQEVSPELGAMLAELRGYAGPADAARMDAALRAALVELRALQADVNADRFPVEATQEAVGQAAELAPLLEQLSAAWNARDGARVDALLAQVQGVFPVVEPPSTDKARLDAEVRASISAAMKGFSLKPLSG